MSHYRTLAAFLGMCPYQHRSGKSIYRQPRMRSFGPAYPRKLLTLVARSTVTHNDLFKKYYARTLSEGKAKQLALSNISNELIKLACALMNNNFRYTVDLSFYKSYIPKYILTKS